VVTYKRRGYKRKEEGERIKNGVDSILYSYVLVDTKLGYYVSDENYFIFHELISYTKIKFQKCAKA